MVVSNVHAIAKEMDVGRNGCVSQTQQGTRQAACSDEEFFRWPLCSGDETLMQV